MARDGKTNRILQVWTERGTDGEIVHVEGEVDLTSAHELREHLNKIVGGTRPIIIDFSKLGYLDLQGVRALEECYRGAQHHGQHMVLVGSTPIVHKLLTILNLNQRIPVVDSLGEALQLIKAD
jgi:anti-anti-sigma factor